MLSFEKGHRRRAKGMHSDQVFGRTVSFGQIAFGQPFAGDDLQVGVMKPVTIGMKIPNKRKNITGL